MHLVLLVANVATRAKRLRAQPGACPRVILGYSSSRFVGVNDSVGDALEQWASSTCPIEPRSSYLSSSLPSHSGLGFEAIRFLEGYWGSARPCEPCPISSVHATSAIAIACPVFDPLLKHAGTVHVHQLMFISFNRRIVARLTTVAGKGLIRTARRLRSPALNTTLTRRSS